jgi:hypothetical protein
VPAIQIDASHPSRRSQALADIAAAVARRAHDSHELRVKQRIVEEQARHMPSFD